MASNIRSTTQRLQVFFAIDKLLGYSIGRGRRLFSEFNRSGSSVSSASNRAEDGQRGFEINVDTLRPILVEMVHRLFVYCFKKCDVQYWVPTERC